MDARHLEVAHARIDVAGGDGRPGEVDLGHRVVETHHRGEIDGGALVPLAGEVVEHVRGGAVAGVQHASVIYPAVVSGFAPRQMDVAREHAQAALDELPRQFGRERHSVHRRARPGEQAGEGRRAVADTDFGEHAQRLLVDELLVTVGEVLQSRSRHAPPRSAARPAGRRCRSVSSTPAACIAAELRAARALTQQDVALSTFGHSVVACAGKTPACASSPSGG